MKKKSSIHFFFVFFYFSVHKRRIDVRLRYNDYYNEKREEKYVIWEMASKLLNMWIKEDYQEYAHNQAFDEKGRESPFQRFSPSC